ncbi:hypothetical protein [Streptomyces sp. NPDC047024]|uniref:hypothetical protein n=1 Tax=Streptomyces sp. NPDC047024 TaxID=3155476 RepID=UPI0033F9851A
MINIRNPPNTAGGVRYRSTIQAIEECGFDTFTCCQDVSETNTDWPEKLPHMREWVESKRGWILIDFPVDSGLAFLSAVANSGPQDAFYVRMTPWAAPDAWDMTDRQTDGRGHVPGEAGLAVSSPATAGEFPRVRPPGTDSPPPRTRRSVPPAPTDWSTIGR